MGPTHPDKVTAQPLSTSEEASSSIKRPTWIPNSLRTQLIRLKPARLVNPFHFFDESTPLVPTYAAWLRSRNVIRVLHDIMDGVNSTDYRHMAQVPK